MCTFGTDLCKIDYVLVVDLHLGPVPRKLIRLRQVLMDGYHPLDVLLFGCGDQRRIEQVHALLHLVTHHMYKTNIALYTDESGRAFLQESKRLLH